jgi:hypothetical protein
MIITLNQVEEPGINPELISRLFIRVTSKG